VARASGDLANKLPLAGPGGCDLIPSLGAPAYQRDTRAELWQSRLLLRAEERAGYEHHAGLGAPTATWRGLS
jgi:hypothetical protein